ncbi:hypothetical protein [Mangrovicoccus algicola]|uniref:Uncharacterized protein n=1 Tax=Mangrovicoccus algicola TaxID=2771008 RepID=A0A8J7CVP0_9RHOB|nr:hypothetical protein [Mangrovicoccus algicola]MBE3636717.1 hypothetical protein [Mangrovicoccus algicola]
MVEVELRARNVGHAPAVNIVRSVQPKRITRGEPLVFGHGGGADSGVLPPGGETFFHAARVSLFQEEDGACRTAINILLDYDDPISGRHHDSGATFQVTAAPGPEGVITPRVTILTGEGLNRLG